MRNISSVYIVEPIDQGWIIERIMRDINAELNARSISSKIGLGVNYNGEDVIFNSRFLTSTSDCRARVNSLFVTHIDDKSKELHFKSISSGFNSFVCMSPHDAHFVAALLGSNLSVCGIDLPSRNLYIRPMRLAIFSACYEDHRKNEQWIIDYFQDRPADYRRNFIFCFLGLGWENFCGRLSVLDMNYEIYRFSRDTPGEYDFYKEILSSMDTLLYLGFDGGAMSIYDALSAGIPVLVPNISYHRGLNDSVTLFDDKSGFFREMDRLNFDRVGLLDSLRARSLSSYVDRLLCHWNSVANGDIDASSNNDGISLSPRNTEALNLYRGHYRRISFTRARTALIRFLQHYRFYSF
jgi:hypothetical protein